MAPKPYSIIVYGASGFAGQLVARYLSQHAAVMQASEPLKWAVAGRNVDKVKQKMEEVGIKDVDIIKADSTDVGSLQRLVSQTKLVIALAGPYTHYGEPLYKACAESGTHYVDLTGESSFVGNMVTRHARAAISTRALLVSSCGYDSIPSDLSTFLAVQRLKGLAPGVEVGEVRSSFQQKGTASGGTVATALALMESPAEDKAIARNPYGISPVTGAHKPKPFLATSTTFQGKRTWGAFWVMGPFNSQIVRRSWGIFESSDPSSKALSYGSAFSYQESLKTGGPIQAILISVTIYLSFLTLALFSPARWALRKWGIQPGEGPSPEAQRNGWFKVTTTAKSVDKKHEVQVVMRGKGDPGYSATAKMIVESALAIVLDYERLPPLARHGGPLTPATALGSVLVERLEATGDFSFTSDSSKTS